MSGNTRCTLTRSASEGNRNPRLHFGLVGSLATCAKCYPNRRTLEPGRSLPVFSACHLLAVMLAPRAGRKENCRRGPTQVLVRENGRVGSLTYFALNLRDMLLTMMSRLAVWD